jgi:hypothetical protein
MWPVVFELHAYHTELQLAHVRINNLLSLMQLNTCTKQQFSVVNATYHETWFVPATTEVVNGCNLELKKVTC